MFANQKLSEWLWKSGQSPALTAAVKQPVLVDSRPGLSLQVAEKMRFRRVYFAGWFRGTATLPELALTLTFQKNGSTVREDKFGILQEVNALFPTSLSQLFSLWPPMPPFSYSEIANAVLPVNPPSLQGGDVPGQIVVCAPDVNMLVTAYIRMSPWVTCEEADELHLFADAYVETGTPSVGLWLGCQSSSVPF